MKTLLRYLLFQIPGLALTAVVAFAFVEAGVVTSTTGIIVVVLWAAKDAVLYPFVKGAYGPDSETSPAQQLVGSEGIATQPIDPGGYARIGAELWRCTTMPSTPIETGTRVRVVDAHGLTLGVEPLPPDPEPSDPPHLAPESAERPVGEERELPTPRER